MKRIVQVWVLMILVLAVAVSVLAATGAGSRLLAGGACPMVGWRTSPAGCASLTSPLGGLAFDPGDLRPQPMVGWR